MVDIPDVKIGIISCSGEEMAEGTISRIATRKVLDELRPQQTCTICLPLFIAGDNQEREFARAHPTITVDGCEKLCAKKATEKHSGNVSASINVKDFMKGGELLANRRVLGEREAEIADRVARKIVDYVDEIISRKGGK